jgi:copper oxidase (laccase) domain-containing protein
MAHDAKAAAAFTAHGNQGKYHADIYRLARQRLDKLGISRIYGGSFCTYHQRDKFFSYRRDGVTGRMGTFVWLG